MKVSVNIIGMEVSVNIIDMEVSVNIVRLFRRRLLMSFRSEGAGKGFSFGGEGLPFCYYYSDER